MAFYQACYGKPGNNWQLLNVSKETPPYMVSFFESLGNGCTPQNIGTDVLIDKNGNQVVLYELISAENTICVLRAKYGERDSFGRPKMFAHGFLFPAEGGYKNPANFLSIADSNFHFSDAETVSIPLQLNKDESMSLEDAARICQIDAPKWQQLMKCVYAMLSSPTDYPLYICCNGDLNTIKAAIMCILSALPYSLRYQLSFSNANSLAYAKFKRIMFVETVPDGSYYFDLLSGETNLNSEINEIEQYPEKYAACHAFCSMTIDQFADYCNSIQKVLDQLSFTYITEIDETNLAHLYVTGLDNVDSLSDSNFMKFLLELLVRSPMQNAFADDFITTVLEKFDKRALLPTESMFKRIELRSDKTTSADFIEVYKRIRMRALLSKGSEEVLSFLAEQYRKSKSIFTEWVKLIQSIPGGNENIELFFDNRIKICKSYEDIIKTNSDVLSYCCNSEKLKKSILVRIFNIAKEKVINSSLSHANYGYELESVSSCIEKVNSPYKERILNELVFEFWRNFDYSMFEFSDKCIENCANMIPDKKATPRVPADQKAFIKSSNVSLLSDIYDAVSKYKSGFGGASYWEVEKSVGAFNEKKQLQPQESEIIMRTLKEFLHKSMFNSDGDRHFCMWLSFIRLGVKIANPIPHFIRWKLPVVCAPECFEIAYKESVRMREIKQSIKKWLVEVIEDPEYYRVSADYVKILKKDLKVIEDYAKELAADEKRKEKEQRKAEKKSDRFSSDDYFVDDETFSERDTDHKKSFLGGLFGGKKK